MNHTVLAGLINALLNQQAFLKARLAQHAGRAFSVETPLTMLNGIYFKVQSDGQLICESPSVDDAKPDLHLILTRWPSFPPSPETIKSSVQIQGDARFADSLAFILSNLNFKPGDFVQPVLGDVVANRADRVFDLIRQKLFSH